MTMTGGAFNTVVTVAATSGVAISENPLRRKVCFVNDSANAMYIAKGATATVNSGIRLNASGGSYNDEMDSFGYIYRGVYTVIGTAGDKLLICEEPGYVRS